MNNRIHFEVSERKILLRIIDLLSVLFGIYCLQLFLDYDYLTINRDNGVAIFVLILYIMVFGTIFEIYDLQKSNKIYTTFKNVVLTTSLTVLFYLLTPILTPYLPDNRIQILYFYLIIISSIFLWRLAYISFVASPRFYKKVLLIGEMVHIKNIVSTLNLSDPNYKIIGFINSEGTNNGIVNNAGLQEFNAKDLKKVIETQNISEVLVTTQKPENIATNIYYDLILLFEKGFVIREYTQVYEELTNKIPVEYIGKDFYKYLPFSRNNQNKLYLFFHRVFDILFSVLGLVLFFILSPVIIMGNLIANRGPLFYVQQRIGKNGNPFNIIKLRSMVKDAEKNGAKWAKKNDTRITSFGSFLRNMRLDELPQFINVIKGEMSIIGPRPERPVFVKELSKVIPFYEMRHVIKPGLTGWAQVNMHYGSSVDDSSKKLQYDLFYIKHRSIFLDLNIFVKTLSTILYYRGR